MPWLQQTHPFLVQNILDENTAVEYLFAILNGRQLIFLSILVEEKTLRACFSSIHSQSQSELEQKYWCSSCRWSQSEKLYLPDGWAKSLVLHMCVWYNLFSLRVLFGCKWVVNKCLFNKYLYGLVFVFQVIPLDITVELQKQIMSELEILYKVWTFFLCAWLLDLYLYIIFNVVHSSFQWIRALKMWTPGVISYLKCCIPSQFH